MKSRANKLSGIENEKESTTQIYFSTKRREV